MEKGLRNIFYDFTTSYTPFSLPTNDWKDHHENNM